MYVILTISFKITAEESEIEIITKICFSSYLADEGMYQRFGMHNYVLSFIYCHEMRLHCFFFLLSIARLMRLDHL